MSSILTPLELMRGILAIASEERSLRSVLRRSARLVVAATGADACFVHVVEEDSHGIVLMGATPDEFDNLAGTIRLRMGEGVAGWVAQHGEAAVVEDKWSDSRYRYIPELRGEDYRSLISVPLLRPQRQVVGVLNVHAHDAGLFVPGVRARVEEVADLLAGIVDAVLLQDRLRNREERLERFAEQTIEMQESERRRTAGDIHDGISQRLVSAWYHLRAARAHTVDPGLLDELSAAESLLSEALDEARSAIAGLRPPVLDDLGLAAAIQSLAAQAGGFDVDVDVQVDQLPSHIEMCIYRVTQEALQNALKHAAASAVTVRLTETAGSVALTVRDDGHGFDPSAAGDTSGYGLAGMHERAALIGAGFELISAPGDGTTVRLVIPPAALQSGGG